MGGDARAGRWIIAAGLCVAAAGPFAALRQPAPPAARSVVVISDLHMGPGRDGPRWHAVEDFRWRDEFIAFLNAIDAEGAGGTDLVLNGDTFELLQAAAPGCRYDAARLGCTEREALARLEAAAAAHAAELQAIGAFARSGANRVYVVPGDHDAALLFPAVRDRALQAFGQHESRIQIMESGGWLSADGRVYVEHGHQLALAADRFSSWPKPFVPAAGRIHLERPWGEQIALPLYDRAEPRYPLVDNIAEEGIGAKYVAAEEGSDSPEAVSALLRYFLTKTAWQQFRMDLDDGEVRPPVWEIGAIRRDIGAFLAASIPPDDPFAASVAKASAAGALAASGLDLTDEAIVAICDYRAAIRRARRRMERVLTQLSGVGPPVAECPRTPETVGSGFEDYWRSRNATFTKHIGAARERLARDRLAARPFEIFVYGHTHLPDRAFRPGGEEGPIVAASGAWQRTIHPVALDQRAKDSGIPVRELLRQLQPEDLPACYSFLRITPAARTPEPRAWQRTAEGSWAMAASCAR
jgi:UDP-2,3-diacylglucosamine pyrophosphatase LpxH